MGPRHRCGLLALPSYEYQVAQAALARSFPGRFDKFVVPCVVASGDVQGSKGTEPLSFRCRARGPAGVVSQKVTVPLSLPAQTQGRRGWAQGWARGAWARAELGVQEQCRQRPLPLQSPQHPVPGAVVPGGGTVPHSDL